LIPRTYYGPINRAFAALDPDKDKQAALRSDLEQLWSEHNQASEVEPRSKPNILRLLPSVLDRIG
jgi:hypothetical protein